MRAKTVYFQTVVKFHLNDLVPEEGLLIKLGEYCKSAIKNHMNESGNMGDEFNWQSPNFPGIPTFTVELIYPHTDSAESKAEGES